MDESLKNVSNSNKAASENPQKKKVDPPNLKGKVKVKKRNGVVKFAEAFLPEDRKDVSNYIATEVFIPTVKKILEQVFHIFLYGISDSYLSGGSSRHESRSYQNYYDRKRSVASPRRSQQSRSVYISDEDFVFEEKEDAEDFLKWMMQVIREDGYIRLSETKEEFGMTWDYTEAKYGWSNLNGWRIIDTHDPDGRYVLRLPKPFPVE